MRSGSFVYDAQLSLDDWVPTQKELQVLSVEMIKFCQKNYPIQCLDVSTDLALDIFKLNPHKTQQIPDIAAHNGGKVTLYKAGPHIDISRGPMVTSTDHLGRITVANVIKLNTDVEGAPIYRFQGVSLPRSIVLNHFAYSLLEERAKKLVSILKFFSMSRLFFFYEISGLLETFFNTYTTLLQFCILYNYRILQEYQENIVL